MSTVSSLAQVDSGISVLQSAFLLTMILMNGFKSRVNRHLLSLGFSFSTVFLCAFLLIIFLFLVTPCHVAVQPFLE